MISVIIGGIDYTDKIKRQSFRIDQILTSEADSLKLTLLESTTRPSVTDVVKVYDDETLIFAGRVLSVRTSTDRRLVTFDIVAKDWTVAIDGETVVQTFENQTVAEIIRDILGVGYSASFDGAVSSGISCGDFSLADATDQKTSIFGAFMTSDATVEKTIVGRFRELSGDYQARVYLNADGTLSFDASSGGTTIETLTTDESYNDGLKHFFACVFNAGAVNIYIDGALVKSSTFAFTTLNAPTSVDMTIGCHLDASSAETSRMIGLIDEVGIVHDAIDSDNVNLLYNDGLGRYSYGNLALEAHYHFNEGTGSTTLDETGLGHDGTFSGSVAWGNDLVTETGITAQNTTCPTNVEFIKFDYEQPSVCFQRLAELAGYDWYIDYEADLHFFKSLDESAPYNLTDDSNNYRYDTLSISEDSSQIRNVVFVRGSEYLGLEYTEAIIADGDQTTFPLSYKYKGISVMVDSVVQDVGLDFINDPALFDCLHNFEMKTIKFPEATKPTAGQLVEITGQPYIPLLVRVEDSSSINRYGTRAIRIIDKTIKDRDAGKARAQAELRTYRNTVSEGGFETWTSGLRAGQSIEVNSDDRLISETYIINKIAISLESESLYRYQVSLVSKRTYDILTLLQALLSKRDISEDRDEVLDKIYNIADDVRITGAITTVASKAVSDTVEAVDTVRTIEPVFVAGHYIPTDSSDLNRSPNADSGAFVQTNGAILASGYETEDASGVYEVEDSSAYYIIE